MLRTLAVLAVFAASVLFGCNRSSRLRMRCNILEEMTASIRQIKRGQTYTNQTTATLLAGCGSAETRAVFEMLSIEVHAGSTPLSAWENVCDVSQNVFAALSQEDQKALSIYFSMLGGSDRCSQIKHADATLHLLDTLLADAKKTYALRGRIYRYMGVLLGAGAAILLI